MPEFKMSRPDRAVEAVARLQAAGYEAGVNVPAEQDTHAYVSAWATEQNDDADGIEPLVREVDPEVLPTGEEPNAASHPDRSTQ
jgi:hypothetical protein